MKTNRLYIAALLFCLGGVAVQANERTGVAIIQSQADVRNDSLYVNVVIETKDLKIKSREALILTPVIQTPDRTQELPAIFLGGRNKFKAYKRAQAFGAPELNFIKVPAGRDESTTLNYSYAMPYDPWMEPANVQLKEEIYGCASCQKYIDWTLLADYITLPVFPPEIVYITPPVETVKSRNMSGKAYLDFQVGKSVILPEFKRNASELSKINDVVTQVKNNKYATVTSIDLSGYASPEGPEQLNQKLSTERALALKNYLQDKYGYKQDLFSSQGKGEDWAGLEKALQNSNMPEKDAVLKIITSSASETEKDKQVKALSKGAVYKQLLEEYYPPLRRVEYQLNYTIQAFTVTQGLEIFQTAPGQLSLNEMFLVANTYPKGSPKFNEVFDVAVRVFPQDPIANMNAAAAALESNDTQRAHLYLDKCKDIPEAWNNIGVMYFIEGDFDNAQNYLQKAKSVNPKEAGYNLEQVAKQKRK